VNKGSSRRTKQQLGKAEEEAKKVQEEANSN
jgi:hypothetical protein